MFNVGDRVVYPMHGAGIIEKIEEKEILGQKKKYYIMKLPLGDMKVMIPIDNAERIGLRQVVDEEKLTKVFSVLRDSKSTMSTNWNRRYRANLQKIKTGDIYSVAEVVRNLMLRDLEKGLSAGERKLLENAKQILISELIMVKDIEEEKATELVDSIFIEEEGAN